MFLGSRLPRGRCTLVHLAGGRHVSRGSERPARGPSSPGPRRFRRLYTWVRLEAALAGVTACLSGFVLAVYPHGERCTEETAGGSVVLFIAVYGAMAAVILGGVLLAVSAILAVRSPGPGLGRLVVVTGAAVLLATLVFAGFTVECFAPGGLGV